MTITLVVEDGTGKSDANTLLALSGLKGYADERGTSYSAYTDEQLNGALVRASAFLTNAFVWGGLKVHGRDQTMAWPRVNMIDREGWVIPYTEVPREVVAACAEIAIYEAATPGAMNPSVVQSDKVRSKQIGSIRVEYANLFTSASDARPTLTIIHDLLAPFLSNGRGSTLSGKTARG